MPKKLDLSGKRFVRLIVIERIYLHPKRVQWRCKCDCGKETISMGHSLLHGFTKSCGCLNRENHTVHGHITQNKRSPTYKSWESMKARCNKQTNDNYKYYGGKGIHVCEHWMKFKYFLADMGERPDRKHTLERLDSNKDYEPGNCIWADSFVQNNHKPNNLPLITFQNRTLSIAQLAKEFHLSYGVLRFRIKSGWNIEKALTTPVRR